MPFRYVSYFFLRLRLGIAGGMAAQRTMSTEQDQAREIAERIARRVSAESPQPIRPQQSGEVSSELAAVRAGLSELQRKISQLEAKISSAGNSPVTSPTNLSL